jgi:hypothetical protein
MRVLFSSTRGAGHLQPLLPYARALVARRHEVAVAAPAEVSKTVRDAGLLHLPFDHPGDAALAPIWARLRGTSESEMMTIAASELFAGVNAKAALPKLLETIRAWRPDVVVSARRLGDGDEDNSNFEERGALRHLPPDRQQRC